MTVVIDNLVKEDLVERTSDPSDKRIKRIHITQKGTKAIAAMFPNHIININEIFNVLSDSEKKDLVVILKKLSGF